MKTNSDQIIKQYKKIAYETPILKKQEELELIKQYKNSKDDKEIEKSKNILINSYLRTVIKEAEKYGYRNNLDILDLIQCGIVGIMNSLNKFDLDQYKEVTSNTGSLFAYYTYRAIIMEIQAYYRMNVRAVGVPDSINMKLNKINQMFKRGELNEGYGTDQMIQYIAEKLDLRIKEVKLLLSLFKPSVELDKPLEDDENHDSISDYKDILLKSFDESNPYKEYRKFDDNNYLFKNLGYLTPEERYIIINRYGIRCEEKKPDEIAAGLNKSQAYVTLKIKSIQEKLKKLMNRPVDSIYETDKEKQDEIQFNQLQNL